MIIIDVVVDTFWAPLAAANFRSFLGLGGDNAPTVVYINTFLRSIDKIDDIKMVSITNTQVYYYNYLL